MCIFFVLVNRKVVIIKFVSFAALFAIILYFAYPEFKDLINDALKSITSASLSANAAEDGSSLSIRINLLKNAVYILRDSFCFGIGFYF